ncbi:hypothetical protein ACWEKM_16470 [Streptomyces sp. NPDC004752]
MQARFASTKGLYQEVGSVTPPAALGTSTGLRNAGSTAERLAEPPLPRHAFTAFAALDVVLSEVAR